MSDVDLAVVDEIVAAQQGRPGEVIAILQGLQERFQYLPEAALHRVLETTDITAANLMGVATFYAQFRMEPVGKHIIKLCDGTACHVIGAKNLTEALETHLDVRDGETTQDQKYTLESVACLGCCSLAPVMMIGENTYGKLSGAEAVKIVKNIRIKEQGK